MKILNAKELCNEFNFSATLLYKFRKAGMPYHQLPHGRAYYLPNEVEAWLKQAGYHQESITVWSE